MTRRVAVKIAYLGEGFSGSQYQPGFRTVEGEILSNLSMIGGGRTAEWFNLKCASRTDSGVNSLGNVVVFNTDIRNDRELLKGLNAVSDGVYYRAIAEVDETFNVRWANHRIYKYVLKTAGMDKDATEACLKLFEGKHDFRNFSKQDGKSTETEIESISMEWGDGTAVIRFQARFFLWHLIRRIVGAVSAVGRGNAALEDAQRALDGESISFGTARADALTLVDIIYKNVEFYVPDSSLLDETIEEGLFRCSLRSLFFSSL
ncbi:MAG: tRNA pseudouridine(38-40) synthase TruA [Thermoplasmatales archaeon]|jgi:tRNA pseudouridine38-40 synthase|nr:tRNA pseudouridine(38-40) synthase TruA [Thermoplasmatales archaeon]